VTGTVSLTARFEAARPRLGALAYRMLGSVDDAEDAVQEAWLRLSRGDPDDAGEIANLDAWLTTVVARICLNTLRSRRASPREEFVAHVARLDGPGRIKVITAQRPWLSAAVPTQPGVAVSSCHLD
jgi:DNA-directed RNA polymerase specialized sigma24 family protein